MVWAKVHSKHNKPPAPPQWRTLEEICPGAVHYGTPMSRWTTLRVGGPADALVQPSSARQAMEVIKWAKDMHIPAYIMGNGSNLLVLDGGIRGVVVKIGSRLSGFKWIQKGDRVLISAMAGTPLSTLMANTIKNGWTGLEFLVGIPGSVGGALAMNAGSADQWMDTVVESITMVTAKGVIETWPRRRFAFGYRWVELPQGTAIVEAELNLLAASRDRVIKEMGRRMRERRKNQPPPVRTAGSVFKNPPGDFAGRLIEACGLKGRRVGGAMVSERHANFIITTEGATAADVLCLMGQIREEVWIRTGVSLEPEVRVLGDPT